MTLQSLLVATVNVELPTYTKSQGARVATFAVKYTGLPARIRPVSADVAAKFLRDGLQVSHTVYVGSPGGNLALDPVIVQQKDRIIFGTRYFEVRGVRNVDEVSRYLILTCQEIQLGDA